MTQKEKDEKWMRVALDEARCAMEQGEHPIACVLVGGDQELARGQTNVARQGSIVCHSELIALREAGWDIFTSERPLTIYTTLESCLMCIGAAMQCEVDEIVYAMPAKPDGGSKYVPKINEMGDKAPIIRSRVLYEEAVALMKQDLVKNPDHPGIAYAKALLDGID